MAVSYKTNPTTLTLVNPGKPPKATSKGGTMAKQKSKKRKKGSSQALLAQARKANKKVKRVSKKHVSKPKAKPRAASQKQALSFSKQVDKAIKAAERREKASAAKAAKTIAMTSAEIKKMRVETAKTVADASKTIKNAVSEVKKMAKSKKAAKPRKAIKPTKSRKAKPGVRSAKKGAKVTKNGRIMIDGKFDKATPSNLAKLSASDKAKFEKLHAAAPAAAPAKPKRKPSKKRKSEPAARKTTSKPAKRKTSKRKSTAKRKVISRVGWVKKGAKKPTKPTRRPTAKSKPRYDHTRRPRKGQSLPGYYPIQARWSYRKNPGGSVYDPKSHRFVSAASARGRSLLGGGVRKGRKGGKRSMWRSNPVNRVLGKIRRNPIGGVVMKALKTAIPVSVGFFGSRAVANFVSGRALPSFIPASMAPYAPFVAQLAFGVAWHMGAGKVEALRPYRDAGTAGVGISILEALVNRFAPSSIQQLTATPPAGLGGYNYDAYRRGMGDPWAGYYPGDTAVMNAMGEYVTDDQLDPEFDVGGGMGEYLLPEDLESDFDVDALGEFVTTDSLDPEFEALGDASDLAYAQASMGEFVTDDELDPEFDIGGGMGDAYSTINDMARRQIAMGDDTAMMKVPVITSTFGPSGEAGVFGGGDVSKVSQATAVASAAIQGVKASGGNPAAAIKTAYASVKKNVSIPDAEAKKAVTTAVRAAYRDKGAGVSTSERAYPMAYGEEHEAEPNESEFKVGIFGLNMFNSSDM